MSINHFNNGMYYQNPTISNNVINLDDSHTMYTEELQRYLQAGKIYPSYGVMNYGLNPNYPSSINSQFSQNFNSGLPTAMNGIGSQLGMPLGLPMNHQYSNYTSNNAMNSAFNQMRNIPRSITPPPMNPNIRYGMNGYHPTQGIQSLYQPSYPQSYQNGMMGNFGQIPPQQSFSTLGGLGKPQFINKQFQSIIQPNPQAIKKTQLTASKNESTQKRDRQKLLSKDVKPLHINKQGNIVEIPNIQEKVQQKDQFDFLPKKLPFSDTKRLIEPNQNFYHCACKGYFQYEKSFVCSICKNKFHYRCLNLSEDYQKDSSIACAHCKMKQMDPLNKVQTAIGQFYLMNLTQKCFNCILNFKPYQTYWKQKNPKYQLQIRCIRSGQHMKNLQITWPDQCSIRLNNERLVQVPALQSNSSLKKRKDYSVFVSQSIFNKNPFPNSDISNSIEKTRLSLELKTLTPDQILLKKIRNQYTFVLGVYLVEKLNVDELYAKIMSEDKVEDKDFLKNLMKTSENQVYIDKISIRLLDPFSWQLIKTPVRGHKCTHPQCFDLKTFISLMFSAKNRTWKCPLCSKDSRKFMLDHQQLQLLKKALEYETVPKQVQIFKQGKISFKIQKESDEQDQDNNQIITMKRKIISKQKKSQKKQQLSENVLKGKQS